eukprot:4853855-Pyramimonas_sp.AAC.1
MGSRPFNWEPRRGELETQNAFSLSGTTAVHTERHISSRFSSPQIWRPFAGCIACALGTISMLFSKGK